ncbi:MAG TPA: hypothetical protein PLB10_15385 [Thiolinea sp.]|nr:hypothetical protein [Thiolinea sp.]
MDAVSADKNDLSRYAIPLSEARAKAWIDSLSVTDFGESTRRLFYGLVDFNRRVMPPLSRIRIGEKLKPTLDVLIQNLQRHLAYRAFPLPDRGQRIFNLNQSLLLEFAGLYQLAALDMLTRDQGSKRALQISIYRVIDYLGRYLLSSYSVYQRTRETVWHDIHHMFLLACEHNLEAAKFSGGEEDARSIEARYVQINLLSLFRPYSLRQEEAFRVERFVRNVSKMVRIGRELLDDEVSGDFVHAAILNNDEPAIVMPLSDLPHSPTVRVFKMRELLVHLDRLIQESMHENAGALTLPNGLSRNLAKRMAYHLTTVRSRSANRFPSNEKIATVMGMPNVLEVIRSSARKGSAAQQREEDVLFNSMAYGEVGMGLFGAGNDPEDRDAEQELLADRESGIQIWTVINNSIGGYGLHWPHRETSDARVGELVALRNRNDDEHPWMVGAIKWMEYINQQGLYCGVELLAHTAGVLEVQAVENRSLRQKLPQSGLYLPVAEGVRPEPVLILPAYIFQPGDQLLIGLDGKREIIMLGALDECLGGFAYFHYRTVSGDVKGELSDDNFDSLWNML